MLRSMTGFGAGRARVGSEEIVVELRSVNAKFCEVKARFPRELLSLEAEAIRLVKARLARGGIELNVRRGAGEAATLVPRIDQELAAQYAAHFRALRERLGLVADVALSDILTAEGVVGLEERQPDPEAAGSALRQALGQALDSLVAMREREGEALLADILQRLDALGVHVAALEAQAPLALVQVRERLLRRVEELAGAAAVDPSRLAQEVAILAERSDISEELTRLGSHLAHLRELCAQHEPAGRRLDFLVQEANREANTAGSKSQWVQAASLVVEMKAELERIREQVQNVE